MTTDQITPPAGHSLTKDGGGRPQFICDCCGVREWCDTGKAVRHLRWCDYANVAVSARRTETPAAKEIRLAELALRGLASQDHGLNRDFT